jgi:molybdate transport system substrate-binding protein
VAAAASLQHVLPEVAEAFQRSCGKKVVLSFAASGSIAEQIRHGAPFDVFCSADEKWIAGLVKTGDVLPDSVKTYAVGILVVGFRARFPGLPSGIECLAKGEITRIGIANPDLAPYGHAAFQVLERASLLEQVREKLIYGENVGQVAVYLARGEVDCAFIPMSLASRWELDYFSLPASTCPPVEHVLGVSRHGFRPAQGKEFAQFILGPAGNEILLKHGFGIPSEVGKWE